MSRSRKKLLVTNPCAGVEFPVRLKTVFRPHYMSWSEQQRIEAHAPPYLANVMTIVTETGLRVYKELAPMRKEQFDLKNAIAFIPDSKTPNGVAEIPLTDRAINAFKCQLELAGPGPFLFPSNTLPATKQALSMCGRSRCDARASRTFPLRPPVHLRHQTLAGGVPDEWVTQLLRQGDAQVLKRYSQMKLHLKREALKKMHPTVGEAA